MAYSRIYASWHRVGSADVLLSITRGGPCQHGSMCGCKQCSNDKNESNYNMQPITIQFDVRVRMDYTDATCMFIWAMFGW